MCPNSCFLELLTSTACFEQFVGDRAAFAPELNGPGAAGGAEGVRSLFRTLYGLT